MGSPGVHPTSSCYKLGRSGPSRFGVRPVRSGPSSCLGVGGSRPPGSPRVFPVYPRPPCRSVQNVPLVSYLSSLPILRSGTSGRLPYDPEERRVYVRTQCQRSRCRSLSAETKVTTTKLTVLRRNGWTDVRSDVLTSVATLCPRAPVVRSWSRVRPVIQSPVLTRRPDRCGKG